MSKSEEHMEAREKRLASMTITERMTYPSRLMNKAIRDGHTPSMMIPLPPWLFWNEEEQSN